MAEDPVHSASKQRLIAALRAARELLPGDSRYGDRLSVSGGEPRHVLARRVIELARNRPGVLSEAGLGVLQVWEAVAEGGLRERGDATLAIVFTDLVGFSAWALEAGDETALALLRDVGEAIEPPVAAHGGEVVKRLGDGMMAVFPDARVGLGAVIEARARLRDVEAPGYRPRLRVGMHVGSPRRIGDDYLGVDVNIAARIAEEAADGELLISGDALDALDALDRDAFRARRKLRFKAKGVPGDIAVHSIRPRG